MFEFKQKLPLIIVSKVILTFFEPGGFMLVMPVQLLVMYVVALIGCQLLKFILLSKHSIRTIMGLL